MSSKNEAEKIYMKQYREMLKMCETIEKRISALEDKLNNVHITPIKNPVT